MATRFDRIPVTKDLALAAALDRVIPLIGTNKPTATLVHDLAILGAEAFVEEQDLRSKQLAWVAEVTTSPETPWDLEVLEQIDELAWGIPPQAE
ncbi:MAG: hypothetical protein WAN93_09150 [Solirubrobacteraceae bacterium]